MVESGSSLARSLASLLTRGTWLACLVIAAGWLVGWAGRGTAGAAIMTSGILLVVLLPVVRVVAVLAHFTAAGERRFVAACAVVLVIISVSVAAGL